MDIGGHGGVIALSGGIFETDMLASGFVRGADSGVGVGWESFRIAVACQWLFLGSA